MNEIILSNICPPLLSECGLLAAAEPFYHMDRTAGFNVLIYVTDGTIYVTEDGTDYAVGTGEMLFLKSGIRHCGRREIQKGTRWYYIHFCNSGGEPDCMDENCAARMFKKSAVLPKKLSGLKNSRIERMIERYTDYYYSNDPMKLWDINIRLFELLAQIAVYNNSEEPRLSDKICAYLAANYVKPFSVSDLEKEFYLSYKYMAAVFKREKNTTMQQYHTSVRMNNARRLLRSTFMSVSEVASAVGYSDALYFSRVFRTSEGMCPSAYRKTAVERI